MFCIKVLFTNRASVMSESTFFCASRSNFTYPFAIIMFSISSSIECFIALFTARAGVEVNSICFTSSCYAEIFFIFNSLVEGVCNFANYERNKLYVFCIKVLFTNGASIMSESTFFFASSSNFIYPIAIFMTFGNNSIFLSFATFCTCKCFNTVFCTACRLGYSASISVSCAKAFITIIASVICVFVCMTLWNGDSSSAELVVTNVTFNYAVITTVGCAGFVNYVFDNCDLSVRKLCNFFLCKGSFATDRALLTISKTCFCTSSSLTGNYFVSVALSRDCFLREGSFATNRALLTISKTCLCASSILAGNCFVSVTESRKHFSSCFSAGLASVSLNACIIASRRNSGYAFIPSVTESIFFNRIANYTRLCIFASCFCNVVYAFSVCCYYVKVALSFRSRPILECVIVSVFISLKSKIYALIPFAVPVESGLIRIHTAENDMSISTGDRAFVNAILVFICHLDPSFAITKEVSGKPSIIRGPCSI